MIEVIFAWLLGFASMSVLGAALEDDARMDMIMLRVGLFLCMIVMMIGIKSGNLIRMDALGYLTITAFTQFFGVVIVGAISALFAQLYLEGHILELWVKYSPHTAPTPEVAAGKRARVTGQRKAVVPATLVGTSTKYLTEGLDLRTDTLVQLAWYAFSDHGARTISKMESHLRVGTGHRQRNYLRLIASMGGRPALKPTLHRYWRSVNCSTSLGRSLLTDLCGLAHATGNTDKATIGRLRKIGDALDLTPEEMKQAVSRLR